VVQLSDIELYECVLRYSRCMRCMFWCLDTGVTLGDVVGPPGNRWNREALGGVALGGVIEPLSNL